MKILAVSKVMFNQLLANKGINVTNIEQVKKAAFISIIGTEDSELSCLFVSNKNNVLVLKFDDISEDIEVPIVRPSGTIMLLLKAFNTEQAKQIIDFLGANRHKETLLIHCHAGVSRSGAVATFANDYYMQDYNAFKADNPYILPNPHILQVLNRVYREIQDNHEVNPLLCTCSNAHAEKVGDICGNCDKIYT
jgi:predicted protein tyrosine phosphatase